MRAQILHRTSFPAMAGGEGAGAGVGGGVRAGLGVGFGVGTTGVVGGRVTAGMLWSRRQVRRRRFLRKFFMGLLVARGSVRPIRQ